MLACPWQRQLPTTACRLDWRRLLALAGTIAFLIVGFSNTIFCETVSSGGAYELSASDIDDSSKSPKKSTSSIAYCHSCTMVAIAAKEPSNTIPSIESKQLALRFGSIRPHRPPTETRPPIAL